MRRPSWGEREKYVTREEAIVFFQNQIASIRGIKKGTLVKITVDMKFWNDEWSGKSVKEIQGDLNP